MYDNLRRSNLFKKIFIISKYIIKLYTVHSGVNNEVWWKYIFRNRAAKRTYNNLI